MPFNTWNHGDYVRLGSTDYATRDTLIPVPESGMMKFNLDRGWFEGYQGQVWRNFGYSLSIDVYDLNNQKNVVDFFTMPFYTYDGSFTPIALNPDQMVTYHEADGTIIYLQVN